MKKILVVDDQKEIVELLRSRLQANNYEVLSASDGDIAVAIAQEANPDLIIMDIIMPKLPGGAAIRALKVNAKTTHIPVLILSSVLSNMPRGTEASMLNIDDQFYPALPKPIEIDKLLREIKKILP